MEKIKVNRAYRRPKQEDKSVSWWVFMRDVLKCKTLKTPGTIGYSGDKIHALTIDYLETEDGLGILDVSSWCGSQKWGSSLNPTFFDDPDFETVTCKKCLGRIINRRTA